jgi:hypothetical protein
MSSWADSAAQIPRPKYPNSHFYMPACMLLVALMLGEGGESIEAQELDGWNLGIYCGFGKGCPRRWREVEVDLQLPTVANDGKSRQ